MGNIIASLPLDRIYGQTICLCVDNLLEYCSYDDTHYCFYFARIDPKVNPADERPFISDYVERRMKRLNIKGSDIRDVDECDGMEMDMFDGEKDDESHKESMKKLDEKVRRRIGMMSPLVSAIKAEEESDDGMDQHSRREADEKRHARDVQEAQDRLFDLQQARSTGPGALQLALVSC